MKEDSDKIKASVKRAWIVAISGVLIALITGLFAFVQRAESETQNSANGNQVTIYNQTPSVTEPANQKTAPIRANPHTTQTVPKANPEVTTSSESNIALEPPKFQDSDKNTSENQIVTMPKPVAKPHCEKNNTGDYCFINTTEQTVEVTLCGFHMPVRPGEKKYFYNQKAGVCNYKVWGYNSRIFEDSGQLMIKACETMEFTVK